MLISIGAWLTRHGVSRDDISLSWAQIVGVATLIGTGALNLTSLGDELGWHLSTPWLHRIMALAGAIVWLSARLSTSPLYNQPTTQAIVQQHTLAAQAIQQK